MPSNKDRLYIGLYARFSSDTYHWALLVTPKKAKRTPNEAVRYHAINRPLDQDGVTKNTWFFEKRELVSIRTQLLLVLVLVAKIEGSRDDLEASLRRTPVIQDDPDWNCLVWVRNAFAQLTQDKILGRGVLDWDAVERESFIRRQKEDGRKIPEITTSRINPNLRFDRKEGNGRIKCERCFEEVITIHLVTSY